MDYEVRYQDPLECNILTGWGYYRFHDECGNLVRMKLRQYVDVECDVKIQGKPIFVFTSNDIDWYIGATMTDHRQGFELLGPFPDWEQALIHAKLIQDGA